MWRSADNGDETTPDSDIGTSPGACTTSNIEPSSEFKIDFGAFPLDQPSPETREDHKGENEMVPGPSTGLEVEQELQEKPEPQVYKKEDVEQGDELDSEAGMEVVEASTCDGVTTEVETKPSIAPTSEPDAKANPELDIKHAVKIDTEVDLKADNLYLESVDTPISELDTELKFRPVTETFLSLSDYDSKCFLNSFTHTHTHTLHLTPIPHPPPHSLSISHAF